MAQEDRLEQLKRQEAETESQVQPWNRSALDRVAEQASEVVSHQKSQIENLVDTPFIGASKPVRAIFDLIEKVADTDSTILILGESGTGKELVARAIHNRSNRRNKAFVAVNCGAIPSELLETELFGHVKGAYTGAHTSRIGRFSLAHQGTLFLDEIGTMPPSLQVKILRALQEKEFEPVGGNKTVKSDCRVIAATNIDLEQEVGKGHFREDLYYRLNVIPMNLPPLRERKEDIPALVHHFVGQFNRKKGYNIKDIHSDAMSALIAYNWPGNVRELENICQRMSILKVEGNIDLVDVPPRVLKPKPVASTSVPWAQWIANGIPEGGIAFDALVEQFENDLIMRALEQTKWNKNQAAQLLQVNRTTLVEKIKKRGLNPGSES